MKTSSLAATAVVVAVAAMAWLAPLLWALQRQRHESVLVPPNRGTPPAPLSRDVKPLILYVDAWPTRSVPWMWPMAPGQSFST